MQKAAQRFVFAIAYCLAYEDPQTREALRAWWEAAESESLDANEAARTYLEAAEWALSPALDTPDSPLADRQIALVSGGATRIKAYVFESTRLPEIRGASILLDRINLVDLRGLWAKSGCEEGVIYANGGEILGFAPLSQAAGLADAIEQTYHDETLVAQSVAVTRAYTLRQIRQGLLAGQSVDKEAARRLLGHDPAENVTFGSLVTDLALARFRRREANPEAGRLPELRALAHFETVPFARRCSSCDRRAAVVEAPIAVDEFLPLCEPCARKRVCGQQAKKETVTTAWYQKAGFTWDPDIAEAQELRSWAGKFEQWLGNQGRNDYFRSATPGDVLAPNDLNEIAQAAKPDGYLGIVYADGNNMGGLLEHLSTPAEYASFADAVYQATQKAVFAALAQHAPAPIQVERQGVGHRWIYPFEILSIGGDDLFLLVPAHVALSIACAIARNLEQSLLAEEHFDFRYRKPYDWAAVQRCVRADNDAPELQCQVSLSAGVVLADAHTPVYYLERLAEDLLKSAKKRAKQLLRDHGYRGGTVDFLALKSVTMLSGTVEQFRRASLTIGARRPGGTLYARPYTIAETERLLESVRRLKQAGFPRGQLYRLRDGLRAGYQQSVVDYHYFLSRDPKLREAREAIESCWTDEGRPFLHPWRQRWPKRLQDPDVPESIWGDLVDLYDFVPTEEEYAADSR